MIRYLVEVYKVEIPENGIRRDDIAEATEDWLNRTKHFQYQIQAGTLSEIAFQLVKKETPVSPKYFL